VEMPAAGVGASAIVSLRITPPPVDFMGLLKRIRKALRDLLREEPEPVEVVEPEPDPQPWFSQARNLTYARPAQHGEYQPLCQTGEVSWRQGQNWARLWEQTQERYS
jgi:hypothetical protein